MRVCKDEPQKREAVMIRNSDNENVDETEHKP